MAQPYPYPCASTSRVGRLYAAGLALALTAGCLSDEPGVFTTDINLTTGEHTTDVEVFTTGPLLDTSTGEPMETETTCSAAISCIVNCAIDNSNPGPEADLSCYRECVAGMSTEEWLALFDFGICVYEQCRMEASCTDHGANDDDICRGCIFGKLGNKNTPNCEDEGNACY